MFYYGYRSRYATMGSCGLVIVKRRGLFWVCWSRHDVHPEGLGVAVVEGIPSEPEEYRRWLECQRATYDLLATQLDERVLTITPADLTPEGRKDRSHHTIDDRLSALPTVLPPSILLTDDRQFAYTLDLDASVFTVNHGAHFALSAIPRGAAEDYWIKCLDLDEYGRQTVSARLCPAASIGSPAAEASAWHDAMEVGEYSEVYSWLGCTLVHPRATIDAARPDAHARVLSGVLFDGFHRRYRPLLELLLLQWRPGDFAFREVAYAVLSLAAGQFFFVAESQWEGSVGDGYLTLPGNPAVTEGPVPEFAMGCHLPGEAPGSAPEETMYWLSGVLIGLECDLTDRQTREAAIAKAVEFGLQEGKLHFHCVLTSLLDIVLIQVFFNRDRTPNVMHTPPLSLFNIDHLDLLSTTPLSRPPAPPTNPLKPRPAPNLPLTSSTTLSIYHPAFTALTNFLAAALDATLKPTTPPNHGVFPAEIYLRILHHADDATYAAFATVSRPLRAYTRQNLRFAATHTLTAFHEPLAFAVLNHATRTSALFQGSWSEGAGRCVWSRGGGAVGDGQAEVVRGGSGDRFPVIGVGTGRWSILSQVGVFFETSGARGVSSQGASGGGGVVRRLKDIPFQIYPPLPGLPPGSELYATRPSTPGVLAQTWSSYLTNFFPLLTTPTHLSLLPPGVRELRATRHRRAEILWVYLRTPGFEAQEGGLLAWIRGRLARKWGGDAKVLVVSGGVVKFFRFVFRGAELVGGWGVAGEEEEGGEAGTEERLEFAVGDWQQREGVTRALQTLGARMRDREARCRRLEEWEDAVRRGWGREWYGGVYRGGQGAYD